MAASPREIAAFDRSFQADLRRWGGTAALTSFALNMVWLGCLVSLARTGDLSAQVALRPAVFRLSIGACLVLTLCQIPVAAAMASLAWERAPGRAVAGGLVYLLYVPLNAAAYFSFGRLAPVVLAPGAAVPEPALVAQLVEVGGRVGLTGNLAVLGYGLLGCGWCLLAPALRSRGPGWRWASAFLAGSGVASVAGAAGSFLDAAWLEPASMLGGVLSVPALALVGAALIRGR